MTERKPEDYADILHLPHHTATHRAHMSMQNRAAQFAPFAALTGYGDALEETERLTDHRITLEEDAAAEISERLALLASCLPDQPTVQITYFIPDRQKEGGRYCTVTGTVKKLDTYRHALLMTDGEQIPLEEIVELSGTLFSCEE